MRKTFLLLLFAGCVTHLNAQTSLGALSGFANLGGRQATTSGLNSTNYQQGIVPSATITVYLTGTTTKATIYKDNSGTPLDNPFTASALGSAAPGQWLFFATVNTGVDVIGSGGIYPNVYATPVTLCKDCYPSAQVTTPIGGPTFETNSTANASQALLNFTDTNGVHWSNPSGGTEEVNVDIQALGGPPKYVRAVYNDVSGAPGSVSINVTGGDLLLAEVAADCYSVQAPSLPTISDSQSDVWFTDASGTGTYIGGTGTGAIAAHAFAAANGTLTVTGTPPSGCGTRIAVMDFQGVGVDVAALQVGSIGTTSLSPSVNATAANEQAIVPVMYNVNPISSPGAQLYSLTASTGSLSAGYQFTALNPAVATTANVTFGASNFPIAALILIKNTLGYGTMSNPMYGPGQMITSSDNSGDPIALLPGTSGYVLTSTGTGTPPTWQPSAAAAGVSSLSASLPIVVSASTGAVTVSCPTCASSSGGSNVQVNGGAVLANVNLATNTGAGQVDFSNPSGSTVNATLHNTSTTLGSTALTLGATTTSVTGLTVDGVSPTTMGYVDATSSIQTQINAKARISTSTSVSLPTTTVTAGQCDASPTTVSASGVTAFYASFSGDYTAISGYGLNQLQVRSYVTTNTINLKRCNPTAADITPGAATINIVAVQ